jgi:hypothetical protein
MASPELTKGIEPTKSSSAASDITDTNSDTSDSNTASSQPSKQSDLNRTAPNSEPFPDLDRAVDDAMCLLVYAAETGVNVDDATRNSILQARASSSVRLDETASATLLAALTKLAAELRPVTADSIRASSNQTKPTILSLRRWTLILAVPIVLFSGLSFVSSSIAGLIRTDITTANDLAVKLRTELGPATSPTGGTPDNPELPKGLNEGDVISQLQQYASTIRAIDARGRQLNWFVFRAEPDPFAQYRWNPKNSQNQANQEKLKEMFQVTVGLPDMPEDADRLTKTYQDVRSFAQNILDLVSVSYGAITNCLLPVLYALLGTCAYLLRCFEEELKTVTFTPSSRANWARFLIAAIGGAVVGLFGNFTITQGASISPLAIAFLVGYAVDVFFSFLDGMVQTFTKRKSSASWPATAT